MSKKLSSELVPGDIVTIYNQSWAGEVIVEGKAELIRDLGNDGHGPPRWEVRWRGFRIASNLDGDYDRPEGERHERLVHTPEQVEEWKQALNDLRAEGLRQTQ